MRSLMIQGPVSQDARMDTENGTNMMSFKMDVYGSFSEDPYPYKVISYDKDLNDTYQKHIKKGRAILVIGEPKETVYRDNDGYHRIRHTLIAHQISYIDGKAENRK